jgi:RNA polymerase sigma-70 factor (ECF subfamily)
LVTGGRPQAGSRWDAEEFTELVRLYDRELLRLCFVISGDVALAQDAVQSTWHRMWRNPPRLRDDTKVKAWLLAVAGNEARQMLRRLRRRREREREAASREVDADIQAEWLDVAVAIAKLDDRARELLALRYVIGLSAPEISAVLRVSPGAVRSRLHRTLKMLREEVADG